MSRRRAPLGHLHGVLACPSGAASHAVVAEREAGRTEGVGLDDLGLDAGQEANTAVVRESLHRTVAEQDSLLQARRKGVGLTSCNMLAATSLPDSVLEHTGAAIGGAARGRRAR